MARPPSRQPTDGELQILKLLWEFGPSELGRICAALNQERKVATTTVATILKVMLEKGLVERRQGERGYQWAAKVSRQTTESGLTHKLIERLFDGSAGRLVAHLIEEGQLSAADRREIQEMLDRGASLLAKPAVAHQQLKPAKAHQPQAKKRRKRGGDQ
jgi:BlaI family transcriptional regulator, penicillinase repressor